LRNGLELDSVSLTTLDQTLQNLVQQGVISRQQAQLKATNKDSI